MTNPTSNFGWQMPTSTDLVTDLPADFAVFGQAVDTSMADLKGGTTNQVLAKNSNTDMDFKWVSDATGMTNPMTTTGDMIYSSSGSTPARLGIGSTGQVVTVSGGVPTWATPSSGSMTLLSTTALTGSSVTVSSISGAYTDLRIFITGYYASSDATMRWRINGITSSDYVVAGLGNAQTMYTETSGQWIQDVNNAANANNSTNFEIKHYTNTEADKQVFIQGYTNNPNGATYVSYSNWNMLVKGTSGSAVTSFTVYPDAGTFSAGTIYIYGVK